MSNLLKKPLTWMILAECAVVAVLILLTWHLIAAPPAQAAAPLQVSVPGASPDVTAQPSPVVPKPPSPIARQLPGLNVDAGFWRLRLGELNRDQAAFEVLEWQIVHSAMDTAQRYLESVVLPAVVQAERGG